MERVPFRRGDKVRDNIIGDIVSVGTMGLVYEIVDKPRLLKTPFMDACKIVREKFCKEVNLLKTLSSPQIPGILDCDLESAVPWCILSRPSWKTLRYKIKTERPISPLQSLRWIFPVAKALGALHTRPEKILHEYLRPENIAFQGEKPVILDLFLKDFGSTSGITLIPQSDFFYVAPEELIDIKAKMDTKSQIYTIGVIFYEILSGNPPYGGIEESYNEENRSLVLEKILSPQVPVPPIRELPKPIPSILKKALQKDKKLRYNDAEEMAQDLQKALRELLLQEAKKSQEEQNLAKAIAFAQEAILYDIEEEYFKELLSKKESLPIPLDFYSHLKEILDIFTKEESKEILYQKIGIEDNPDCWKNFLLDVNLLQESIKKSVPHLKEIKQETDSEDSHIKDDDYSLSDSEAMFFEDIPKEMAVPETYSPTIIPEKTVEIKESTELLDLPQVKEETAKDNKEETAKDNSDVPEEDGVSLFEDISESFIKTEEMQAVFDEKTQPTLPKGFQWLDSHTVLCEKDESQMIYISAGAFIMGSQAMYAFDVERPEHEVYLDDYFIDKHPITWKQYLKFCKEKSYPEPKTPTWGILPDHPVVNINWSDAMEYCKWAGKRLPTEAEWEKSARGGLWLDGDIAKQKKNPKPKRIYPWGDESIKASGTWKANCSEEPVYGKNKGSKSTSPVGYFSTGKSPYGIYDLAGNVWEWTMDWFSSDYYKNSPPKNPKGPEKGEKKDNDPSSSGKVLRGGSWYVGSRFLRTSVRRKRSCEEKGASCGMRCVIAFI